jgi:hypothetical protein
MAELNDLEPIYEESKKKFNFDGFKSRLKRDPDYKNWPKRTQEVSCLLNVYHTMGAHTYHKYAKGGERIGHTPFKLVYLNFENSEILNDIAYNEHRMKGYFLDTLKVIVWFQHIPKPENQPIWGQFNPPEYIMANRIKGDIYRVNDSPKGRNEDGSITSSLSYGLNTNIGANALGGTSGEDAFKKGGANAGVGASMSVGKSFTHAVKDFSFFNKSGKDFMHHEYEMTLYDDGDSKSLIDESHADGLRTKIHDLPIISRSNFPMLSQVTFETKDEEIMNSKVNMVIHVQANFSAVYSKIKGFKRVIDTNHQQLSHTKVVTVDFSSINDPDIHDGGS